MILSSVLLFHGTLQIRSGRTMVYSYFFSTGAVVRAGASAVVGFGASVAVGSGASVVVGFGASVAVGSGASVVVGFGASVAVGSGASVAVGSGASVAVGSGASVAVGSGVSVAVGSGISVSVGAGASVGSDDSVTTSPFSPVAITVYGFAVTQVVNVKITATRNAMTLFTVCFISSNSFLKLIFFFSFFSFESRPFSASVPYSSDAKICILFHSEQNAHKWPVS